MYRVVVDLFVTCGTSTQFPVTQASSKGHSALRRHVLAPLAAVAAAPAVARSATGHLSPGGHKPGGPGSRPLLLVETKTIALVMGRTFNAFPSIQSPIERLAVIIVFSCPSSAAPPLSRPRTVQVRVWRGYDWNRNY